MLYRPILDTKQSIPIPPVAVRYVHVHSSWWAVASLNNQDYASPNCATRRTARELAFKGAYMYLVKKWEKVG